MAKRGDWTTAQRAPAVKALFFVRQSNVKICLIIVAGWVSLKISAVPYVEVLFLHIVLSLLIQYGRLLQ